MQQQFIYWNKKITLELAFKASLAVSWQSLEFNWKTIFTDIISLYSTTVMYLAIKTIEFGEKRKKGYYAVQGHLRSSRLVPIGSPYATSY